MDNSRTVYTLLVSVLLVAVFAGYRLQQGAEVPMHPSSDRVLAVPSDPDRGDSPVDEARLPESELAAGPAPSELLAVLHACMASPEIRPARDSLPALSVNPRVLADCMRGLARIIHQFQSLKGSWFTQ